MTTPVTEEHDSPSEFPDDPPPESGDEGLRILVDVANKHDLEAGVTLHLGGSLVSGTLVSLERYTRGVAEALRSANPESEGHQALAKLFEILGGVSEAPEGEASDAEEQWAPPRCIHLREARVIAPNGHFGPELPWWRGRISAVAGWTMGSLAGED